MLNAAPGLYASVNLTYSPKTSCGECGNNRATASLFVMTSATTMRIAETQ